MECPQDGDRIASHSEMQGAAREPKFERQDSKGGFRKRRESAEVASPRLERKRGGRRGKEMARKVQPKEGRKDREDNGKGWSRPDHTSDCIHLLSPACRVPQVSSVVLFMI